MRESGLYGIRLVYVSEVKELLDALEKCEGLISNEYGSEATTWIKAILAKHGREE
jgi:hypothetical protein